MRLFRRSAGGEDARWIAVGLGNPGSRYAGNRHNAGALALDVLAGRAAAGLKSHKSGCLTAEVTIAGERVVLARAASFMNESGGPVGRLLRWYKSDPARLVVLHDELDIPFGDVRVKVGGGTAGHNGLRSIASHLGTPDFLRVRIGVGRPPGRKDGASYVLEDFSTQQRNELDEVLGRAADAVERIVDVGAERAMNEVNTRP
ncbi:MAG: aminoacyl-tRNA hydrolase [Actinomycetota bacterium]